MNNNVIATILASRQKARAQQLGPYGRLDILTNALLTMLKTSRDRASVIDEDALAQVEGKPPMNDVEITMRTMLKR